MTPVGHARAAFFMLLLFAAPSSAQTPFIWNNTGSLWGQGDNWSTGGIPGAFDLALFGPVGSPLFNSIQQPEIDGDVLIRSLTLAPNVRFGGWTFSNSDETPRTLTIGGTGSSGLTAYGPATYTFDGPTLRGADSTNVLSIRVTNGSTVVLKGESVTNSNIGTVTLAGGRLVLDNTSVNPAGGRLSSAVAATILLRSGTLEFRGNDTTASTFNVGPLSLAVTGVTPSSLNTIRLQPNGQPLTVNFGNTGNFSLRPNAFVAYKFEATSGVLGGGGVNDPKITFTGTPFVNSGGLLATSATSYAVGFAIVSDANGTDFATWNASNGVKAAGATLTSSAVTGTGSISTATSASRVFFNPGAGTQTALGTITNITSRITPTASGAVLNMSSYDLFNNGLMLDGAFDLTITGTGKLGGATTSGGVSAARYIYVNNPNTTLTTNMQVLFDDGTANLSPSSNPLTIFGSGFVVLNGTNQNTLRSDPTKTPRLQMLNLAGGTLRASDSQLGFSSTSVGRFRFNGGGLEIQDGFNGTGASADFKRFLATASSAPGSVQWETNGGFSAYGSDASVNIGGLADPSMLQWGALNFVGDGYALLFGSTKSNAAVTWLNPLQLDNGTAYQLREINVIGGVAGSKAVMAGAIHGSSAADFLKTGTGILELISDNGYQGTTHVKGGTLLANNTAGSATGTNSVVVYETATLGGVGRIAGTVTVLAGSSIRGGSNDLASGTLTIGSSLILDGSVNLGANIEVGVNRTGENLANASLIKIEGGANYLQLTNLDSVSGSKFGIRVNPTTLMVGETYTFKLVEIEGVEDEFNLSGVQRNGIFVNSSSGNAHIDPNEYYLTSTNPAIGFTDVSLFVAQSDGDLYVTFTTAAPEPSCLLLLCAPVLGWIAWRRRRRTCTA